MRDTFKKNGYYLVEDMYGNDFCNDIKQFIDDQKITKDVELNYGNTEKRIWNAHHKNYLVEEFFNDANEFSSLMSSRHSKVSTVLAYKNIPLGDKYESYQEGRWHIDAWKDMLKIFNGLQFILDQNRNPKFWKSKYPSGWEFDGWSMQNKQQVTEITSSGLFIENSTLEQEMEGKYIVFGKGVE